VLRSLNRPAPQKQTPRDESSARRQSIELVKVAVSRLVSLRLPLVL